MANRSIRATRGVELIFDLEHSDAFPSELHARAVQRLNKELVDGAVVVTSSRYRSQLSNRDDAQRKLVKLLQDAIAPPPPKRRKTRPSKAATQRRLDAKDHRSETKQMRRKPNVGD